MSHNRTDLHRFPSFCLSGENKGRSHFTLQMWSTLFHHTCLLLCCLIGRLWLDRFCLFTNRLDHSQICRRGPFALLPLLLFGRASRLAGATLVGWGCCLQVDGCFPRGQTGVFSNVDGEVGVERLQLFRKELIGQRVEAVRAPVESGPFQKVKSRKKNILSQSGTLLCAYYWDLCEYLFQGPTLKEQFDIMGHLLICFLAKS